MNRNAILFLFLSGIFFMRASSQSVSPQVTNTTGGSHAFNTVTIDWSVGEMPLVTTSTTAQLIITNGFLQPLIHTAGGGNSSSSFGPEELKIFPNPASTLVEINFLTQQKGRIRLKLYNASGQKLYEKEMYSNGTGFTEKIDMQRWAASGYVLQVTLDPEPGSVAKQGAFKILRLP